VAADVWAILLARDEGLSLTVTPIRRKKRLIIEVSALTVRSDKRRSQSVSSVMSASPCAQLPENHGAPSAWKPGGRRARQALASHPVQPAQAFRRGFADLVALRCCAAHIFPLSTASMTRSHKSCEYGFGMPAGLRESQQVESKSARFGILTSIQAEDRPL
jgi:hypothetical protein